MKSSQKGNKSVKKHIVSIVSMLIAVMMVIMGTLPVMADAQMDTIKEFRAIQTGIIEWKMEQAGIDSLLSGSVLDHAGESGSDWYAFTGSRIGTVDGQAAYLSRLQDYVEGIYADLENNAASMNATEWHRLALTVSACGGDPTAFGVDADGNPINLVADGTWDCVTGDPGKQGINGYSWALYVLDSKDYEIPEGAAWTREMILEKILEKQYEDGGFALGNVENSDADITAIVLTALAPYADDKEILEAADKAFARLSEIQQDDGTMTTYGERTSESTAWTLIALSAWDKDALTDEMFIKNGKTLYDGLKMFMLEDGSFVHSLDKSEPETEGNSVSMYQVFYAIEAGCRQLEGKNALFDLADASVVTQEEIDEAGASLPELSASDANNSNNASGDDTDDGGMSLTTMVLIGAVAVVLVVVVLFFVLFREKSGKAKTDKSFDDDDDDEW